MLEMSENYFSTPVNDLNDELLHLRLELKTASESKILLLEIFLPFKQFHILKILLKRRSK